MGTGERTMTGMAYRVVNIGSGPPDDGAGLPIIFRGPDWTETRVDADPAVAPDVVADMLGLPADWTATYDAAWSSHAIEHLYPHQVPRAFAEMTRVVRPGGTVMVRVPDLQLAATYIALGKPEETVYVSPLGPISAMDMVYGYRPMVADSPLMAHHTGFTTLTLLARMAAAGLERVQVTSDGRSLWGLGFTADEA